MQNVQCPLISSELVQAGINSTPTTQSTCDTFYWACQDANYNVNLLVDNQGNKVERYAYTPYGVRTAYKAANTGDSELTLAIGYSQSVQLGGVAQPYGLCEFGHQGLAHDEESGLIYNRARMLHPTLGRFVQRDPLGYVDGASQYQYVTSSPTSCRDSTGLRELTADENNIVSRLNTLAESAREDDPEFSKAVQAVISDYKALIDGIKRDENDPLRLRILDNALEIWADTKTAHTYADAAGEGKWKGKNKCNKYVGDVVMKSGVDIMIDPGFMHNKRLPTANEWANPKTVGNFRVVWEVVPKTDGSGSATRIVLEFPLKGKEGSRPPEIGDVIVYPSPGHSGHVGIYLGPTLYISATSRSNHGQEGVVIKGINNEDRQIYRSPD